MRLPNAFSLMDFRCPISSDRRDGPAPNPAAQVHDIYALDEPRLAVFPDYRPERIITLCGIDRQLGHLAIGELFYPSVEAFVAFNVGLQDLQENASQYLEEIVEQVACSANGCSSIDQIVADVLRAAMVHKRHRHIPAYRCAARVADDYLLQLSYCDRDALCTFFNWSSSRTTMKLDAWPLRNRLRHLFREALWSTLPSSQIDMAFPWWHRSIDDSTVLSHK